MATKEMHSEKGEMKKDLAQDKKMVASAVHKHERAMHPGGSCFAYVTDISAGAEVNMCSI